MADVRIPHLGESVTEGVIARWLRRDGDSVKAGEPVLELETAKATMEIAAEASGRLRVLQPEGATVRAGAVVGRIEEEAGEAPPRAEPPAPAAPHAEAPASAEVEGRAGAEIAAPPTGPGPAAERPAADAGLSPAVRRLIAEHGLDPSAIRGTGRGGRLTKEDVLRHLETTGARAPGAAARPTETVAPPAEAEAPAAPPAVAPPFVAPRPATGEPAVRRVPMTPLRRRIAERLVEAQRTAAILTTVNEIDMSALLALRRRFRERFRERHGVDLGLVSLFARAVVHALADFPVLNAQIDGGDIVYHPAVHLGIAVATPRGLVVPVVRDADRLSLSELERAVDELARLAREGRLTPDQLTGGTFTITNGGVFGSLLSTPILNPPQSGILGMHRIQDRPVAVDGQVVIRPMMYVALSYDHRLVDGEPAVRFLVRVKELLEEPARMLLDV
jgi:2-oxoglutarate dehydrogenase E2 component (dihydrolipoamide succinyltransferase)